MLKPIEMNVKNALEQILDKKFDKKTKIIFKDIIDNDDLSLEHSAYFIKGYQSDQRHHYDNFLEEMEYFGISVDMKGRAAKIETRRFKNEFLGLDKDFEESSYMRNLFKYFYILAKEESAFLQTQEEIEKYRKFNKINDQQPLESTMKCIQIDDRGRKELFVRRVKPTLSLDDYADMVMNNLKKREETQRKAERNSIILSNMEKYEKEIEELREMDEFKDNMVPGNTYKHA